VHRDFKPDNVLVGRDGRVRVTDFGLARPEAESDPAPSADELRRSPDVPLTQTGALVGTPAYMAPEQMRGEPIDVRADVFSFCVTVWECLYGSRPFAGRSAIELLHNIGQGASPEPPATGNVPAPLRRLLARGIQASPEARPSLEELLAALKPAARNRARLILGAVALAVLAVAGMRVQQVARTRALCAAGPERLAGVWDGPRKQSLQKALAGRNAAMLAGVEAALDHYAGGWVSDYREACEATHVRGEQSAESLDLRMECLDQRRNALDAFAGGLAEHGDQLADAALAVHHLAPVADCDDVSALRNIVRPTAPPAQVAALRARLLKLQAFRFVSSKSEGDEARALAEEARRAGAFDLAAGAMQTQAAVARGASDLATSSDYYRDAALLAAMARDDVLLAHILIYAAEQEGAIRSNFKKGLEILDEATSVVERVGDKRNVQWELLEARGRIEWNTDHLKDAEGHLRLALAAWERSSYRDPVDHAQILLSLADCLGDEGRFAESGPLYRQALALYHDTLGDDHLQTLTLRNNLALDVYESGNVAEAIEMERAVVAGYERQGDGIGLANALSTLGELVEADRLDEAESLYRRSIALYAKEEYRFDLREPLTGMGRVELARGHPKVALGYLERALAMQNAPELLNSPDRGETELALARALGSGPRAVALATHARDVFKAHPVGVQRAKLLQEAEELVARLSR
jgi:serine/threonine-protein kinase